MYIYTGYVSGSDKKRHIATHPNTNPIGGPLKSLCGPYWLGSAELLDDAEAYIITHPMHDAYNEAMIELQMNTCMNCITKLPVSASNSDG